MTFASHRLSRAQACQCHPELPSAGLARARRGGRRPSARTTGTGSVHRRQAPPGRAGALLLSHGAGHSSWLATVELPLALAAAVRPGFKFKLELGPGPIRVGLGCAASCGSLSPGRAAATRRIMSGAGEPAGETGPARQCRATVAAVIIES